MKPWTIIGLAIVGAVIIVLLSACAAPRFDTNGYYSRGGARPPHCLVQKSPNVQAMEPCR